MWVTVNGGYFENGKFLLVPHIMVKTRKPGHEDTDLINKLVSVTIIKHMKNLKNY